MVEIKNIPVEELKLNEENPRYIYDEDYRELIKSIQDAFWMMDIRPVIYDENKIVLAGNQRLKVCRELGHETIPAMCADDLTDEEKREFILKDNMTFGEWDWDILANLFDEQVLEKTGLIKEFNKAEEELEEKSETGTSKVTCKIGAYNFDITIDQYTEWMDTRADKNDEELESEVRKLLGL